MQDQYLNQQGIRRNRSLQEEEEEKEVAGQEGFGPHRELYYHLQRNSQLGQWISEDKLEEVDEEQLYQQQEAREDGQEQQ